MYFQTWKEWNSPWKVGWWIIFGKEASEIWRRMIIYLFLTRVIEIDRLLCFWCDSLIRLLSVNSFSLGEISCILIQLVAWTWLQLNFTLLTALISAKVGRATSLTRFPVVICWTTSSFYYFTLFTEKNNLTWFAVI